MTDNNQKRNPHQDCGKDFDLDDAAFQAILTRAFSPDMPDPEFSEAYYQRRRRQERKAAMKDAGKYRLFRWDTSVKSDRNAEHGGHVQYRNGAGFAVLTACVTGMAGLAVYGGIGIYNVGRVQPETAFEPGSEILVPEDTQTGGMQEDAETADVVEAVQEQDAELSFSQEMEDISEDMDENIPGNISGNAIEQTAEGDRFFFQCEENAYTAAGGCYALELGWLPDGLEYREDGPYGMKYHNYNDETDAHAITPYGFYRVHDTQMQFIGTVDNVTHITDVTIDAEAGFAKRMLYFERSQGYAMLYVHFIGTPYVAAYFIDGFTEEEVGAFVNDMHLTETNEEAADTLIYNRDMAFQEPDNAQMDILPALIEQSDNYGIAEDAVHLVSVGTTVTLPDNTAVQLCIDNATLYSRFSDVMADITTNSVGLPADYTSYPDSAGYLYAERTGATQEHIQQYILRLDVTLTNTGTVPVQAETGMLFNMRWFSVGEDGIRVSDYDAEKMQRIRHEPDLCNENSFFSFYTTHSHEKNGIYDLRPGESAACVFYYAIDADMADTIYIKLLDGVTGIYDTVEYVNDGYPVLDLCDLPVVAVVAREDN